MLGGPTIGACGHVSPVGSWRGSFPQHERFLSRVTTHSFEPLVDSAAAAEPLKIHRKALERNGPARFWKSTCSLMTCSFQEPRIGSAGPSNQESRPRDSAAARAMSSRPSWLRSATATPALSGQHLGKRHGQSFMIVVVIIQHQPREHVRASDGELERTACDLTGSGTVGE